MNIAIIPARGGSKRIPRKNIKMFCRKPMIAWSIEAAKASGLFSQVIVSTDDIEIADVARHWGADVPFIRPLELSNDFVGTTEVIAHATQWAQDQGWLIETVCCIYATAPFLRQDDLQRGLDLLINGRWAYTFTATEYAAPIFRSFKEVETGGIEMLFPEHFSTRSQDLPILLHDAGQFYWGRPNAWLRGARIFDKHSAPILIPRWRVQDIDTVDDWVRAENLASAIFKL
jgi:pseudaminic acid cytidylyltransferase